MSNYTKQEFDAALAMLDSLTDTQRANLRATAFSVMEKNGLPLTVEGKERFLNIAVQIGEASSETERRVLSLVTGILIFSE